MLTLSYGVIGKTNDVDCNFTSRGGTRKKTECERQKEKMDTVELQNQR